MDVVLEGMAKPRSKVSIHHTQERGTLNLLMFCCSYRKNLKKLYIVHPTFFTRTLVRFISTGSYFISPKFEKKIVQCNSLRELGQHVPLTQLEIPPEVLIWDLKIGAQEDPKESIEDMATIPNMIRDCIDSLKGTFSGNCLLDTEGIFRVSPSNAFLRSAKYAYRLAHRPNLARFVEKDIHLPAALLKSNHSAMSYNVGRRDAALCPRDAAANA
jgi:Rho GTPase-activating protein 1